MPNPSAVVGATGCRKIIHIDMDAFYASVEQRDNPELRGKPVAVGGSRERGVVAAASYEARKFGVRSAMPSITAQRQCPDLVFVKPRFDLYKAISQQIRAIFAEHTPLIEPLSLDEAYLDVTENLQDIPLARDIALAIRAKIKAETGLNASAGISYNKFLAKLASDHRKPNGQHVITPEMGSGFVETLPVGKFHGIGPATNAKMNSLGIFTGLDLRKQDLAFLEANFGKAGGYYYSISRGIDERPVRASRIRKSVGAENTFATDLTEFGPMAAELQPLIDKVWRHCESTGNRGRTVTLKVKFADFEIISRSQSLSDPVGSRPQLERVAIGLLKRLIPTPKAIRLLGVSISALQTDAASDATQMMLDLDQRGEKARLGRPGQIADGPRLREAGSCVEWEWSGPSLSLAIRPAPLAGFPGSGRAWRPVMVMMIRSTAPPIPMTLGNMRSQGVRSLSVSCWMCHHGAVLSADRWPDDMPVPSFGPRMVCTGCGIVGADARPNWKDLQSRPSLTGMQWSD